MDIKKIFCVLLLLSSLFSLILLYLTWKYNPMIPSKAGYITDFQYQWCRLQKWRVDWDSMIRPCRYNMSWDQRDVTSRARTSAFRSYLNYWELSSAGHFSRFWIQSVDMDGDPKSFGGDTWKVYIRQGPASLSPIIIDHNDGQYEVLFLAIEPGVYHAGILLDYTLCNGYRDPPRKFFRNGTNQGSYMDIDEDFLGDISADYINRPLSGRSHFKFTIKERTETTSGYFRYCNDDVSCAQLTSHCDAQCLHMWDGHGRWINKTWKPFSSVQMTSRRVSKRKSLVILGDSNGRRFKEHALNAALCQRVFERCELVENWMYERHIDRTNLTKTDEFNKTFVTDLFQRRLQKPEFNNNQSVLLFNLGAHYSLGVNFSQYQDVITSVIDLLETRDRQTGEALYQMDKIWRTTTMIERQKLVLKRKKPAWTLNMTLFRFHNNQRTQLFHTYATNMMCKAGYKILDMYHLSASYPSGTSDNVHYDYKAFAPAARVLEKYYGG